MKRSRFTEERIVATLGETGTVPVVAKRHGVSEQSIYTWKKRFGSFHGYGHEVMSSATATNWLRPRGACPSVLHSGLAKAIEPDTGRF